VLIQKLVFASEARQSHRVDCTSLPALERPAGDCRAAARNDIAEKRLFLNGLQLAPIQKPVFASEARQSHRVDCTSLPALERPAGDCRATARNDIAEKRHR
jgi:hypothetical protein